MSERHHTLLSTPQILHCELVVNTDLHELTLHLGIISWVPHLPQYFENARFTSVTHSIHSYPPGLRMPFTQCNLLAIEEVSYTSHDNSRDDSSGSKLRSLLEEAFQESREGVAIVWNPIVVVGRRPE